MKSETILINRPAYEYLRNLQHAQRGFEPFEARLMDKSWEYMVMSSNTGGKFVKVHDYDLGGGVGLQDFHTWTTWKVSKVKDILKEAGFQWEPGEEVEYINL